MRDDNYVPRLLAKHDDPLELNAWAFLKCCDERERKFCCYYEYARESKTFCRLRVLQTDPCEGEYDPACADRAFREEKKLRAIIRLPKHLQDFLIELTAPPFPSKPWISLPSDERNRRMQILPGMANLYCSSPRKHFEVPRAEFAVPEMFWILRLPPGCSVEEIEKIFREKLHEYARKQPGLFEERKRRDGWKDRLRYLSALRLRKSLKSHFAKFGEKFSDEDCLAYADLQLKKAGLKSEYPYKKARDLTTKAGRAEKFLNKIFRR